MFTVLTVLALVLGTPMSTAQAAPFGLDCIGVPGKGNWGPEFYASASTVLLPSAQPEYGPEPKADMSKKTLARNYTLYELTNGRGLLWSTYKKDVDGDDSCSIMDIAGNWMAQTVFESAKSLGSFSLAIQDLAMNTAPFQDLYQGKDGTANSLVAKLYATLWAPLGTVMIILCGAWVVVHSKTKSRTKVWQGLGGMVASLFISALLLQGSWYTTVTSEADKAINGFSSAMTEVMLPENVSSKTADPCWLAEGVPNRAKRISSCTMYKAMMFTPWAAGQFGQNANTVIDSGWKGDAGGGWDKDDCSLGYRCTDIRTAQVMAQTFTRADNLGSLAKKGDYFEKVADQMAKGERKSRFNDWRGANPSSRMQVALASSVSNLLLAPSIDIVALFKLFWEGFILVLIIVLPVIGAVAAFPPATFVAREWGNAFTIAFILKAIAWTALTLLMAIYSMILSSNASLGVQVLMLIMVAAGIWHFAIKMMKGAKRSADQAFEAQAAYNDVTSRTGSFARTQARSAARRVVGSRRPSPRGVRRPQGPKGPNASSSGRSGSGPSQPGTTSGGRRPSPRTSDSSSGGRRPEPVTGRSPGAAGSGGRARANTRGDDPDLTPTTPRRTAGRDSLAGANDGTSRPAGSGRTPTPRPDGGGSSGGEGATAAPPARAPSPRARATRPGPEPVSISGPERTDPVPRRRAPRPAPSPEPGELPRRSASPRPPVGETPPRPPAPRED
ncbi:hypothetical protein ACFYXM_28170 [Streptomyces sp. NPDC002476]|uniref:hypothetical protein n=1 Tax=Streptomyces sp. NPDC002476 TaxID=3364648 RepID=UPI0036882DF9